MKTNLTNFPRCCLDEKHFCEIITWKLDFEKELQEMLAKCDKAYPEYWRIKEILGE